MGHDHPVHQCDVDDLIRRLEDQELRIRALEQELERAHRLATLGTMAGSVAHEINNVLTPMLSYAQMALGAREDAALVTKALMKAVEGCERAAGICSSMLGFLRDRGVEETSDVREAIEDAMSALPRDPKRDGIEVEIRVDRGCVARMRPIALQQVLLNLILNALKAMDRSQGRLVIAAHRSTWNTGTAEAEGVEIRVEDTGRGIPSEMLERIFEPLVTSNGGPGSACGTGLGLTICRRLVGEAGGSIAAESQAGRGARFIVRLPAGAQGNGRNQRAA